MSFTENRPAARPSLLAVALIAGTVVGTAAAGPLDPPAGPVAPTMKTLAEVEPRTLISSASTPGDADSQFKITAHGSYYLNGSITISSGREFLEINASNVVVDLGGFRINGAAGSLSGIRVAPGVTNITIRNGSIVGFDQSGIRSDIDVGVTLEDLGITDVGHEGIYVGKGSRLRNITVVDAGADGIQTFGGSIVRDCVVVSAGEAGFYAGGQTSFEGCSSRDNANTGFVLTGGSSVINSIASGNNNYAIASLVNAGGVTVTNNTIAVPVQSSAGGIYLWSESTARNNTIKAEGTTAKCVYLSNNGNRVEGNTTSGGAHGVQAAGTKNLIIGNFHTGPTLAGGAFPVVADNMLGTVVTNPGSLNTSSAFSNHYIP
jgi:hypothetical protein